MFVSKGQIYVFFACIAFGALSGILFSLAYFIKRKIKNKFLRCLPDIFVFIIVSVAFVLFSYELFFSNIRFYMPLGVIIGILLYLKSFNIILAKTLEKLYNKSKENKRKRVKYDRIKS